MVEYTGEVMNETERLSRMVRSRTNGELHFYIMELSPGLYIDAAHVGSNARFMNSSCDPNCETQKWKDAATGVPPSCMHALHAYTHPYLRPTCMHACKVAR